MSLCFVQNYIEEIQILYCLMQMKECNKEYVYLKIKNKKTKKGSSWPFGKVQKERRYRKTKKEEEKKEKEGEKRYSLFLGKLGFSGEDFIKVVSHC